MRNFFFPHYLSGEPFYRAPSMYVTIYDSAFPSAYTLNIRVA